MSQQVKRSEGVRVHPRYTDRPESVTLEGVTVLFRWDDAVFDEPTGRSSWTRHKGMSSASVVSVVDPGAPTMNALAMEGPYWVGFDAVIYGEDAEPGESGAVRTCSGAPEECWIMPRRALRCLRTEGPEDQALWEAVVNRLVDEELQARYLKGAEPGEENLRRIAGALEVLQSQVDCLRAEAVEEGRRLSAMGVSGYRLGQIGPWTQAYWRRVLMESED